jgi:beta-galactosidase/beta-glucuronidase
MRKIILLISLALLSISALAIPRAEYPRPQFERSAWQNLNGEWTYTLDPVKIGWESNYAATKGFDGKIIVPFAPESKLSGVEHKEFIPCIWYQRNITVPAEWAGKDILLNFGAVYYESEIWVDGKFVTRHFGGSDSFTVDLTSVVKPGQTHSLVVVASSDVRGRMQPAGKQALRNDSFFCSYTRTTGIWQTVWMEAVSPARLASVKTVTDIDNSQVFFTVSLSQACAGNKLTIKVKDAGKVVATTTTPVINGSMVVLPIKKAKLWSPESPFLYDVEYVLTDKDGKVCDQVNSYIGMRKVHIEGNKVYLNNQPYYQRLVLDQGFYPEGNWTAPSDDALRGDIELSMQAGFNGARLHQKVFEERFYYWADKLGYLTWGEMPSWGMDANSPEAVRGFLAEWANIINRDINHPSIVTWTPLNEEWWPDQKQYPRFIEDLYKLTKSLDPTRPVNTVSGGINIKGYADIFAIHNYEQNAEQLWKNVYADGNMLHREVMEIIIPEKGNVGFNDPIMESAYPTDEYNRYDGKIPYILDEFGGIKCAEANPAKGKSWGYGDAAMTKEDFYKRLESQVKILMQHTDLVWGFCYTQLTDVEQEENGIYYYNRESKYDMARVKAIFQMPIQQ